MLLLFKLKVYEKNETKISFLLFLISCIIIFVGKLHHELWIDEWHSFGIARTAKNPIDLFTQRQYEGHPYLYYLMLYVFQLISTKTKALLFFHLVFSLGAMYLLIVKSNINIFIKLLLVFSIYFIWEYTVLNRVYCVCLFFIFLYTYLLKQKNISFFASILLITILCQLDVFSAAIAVLLGAFYFFTFKLDITKKIIFIVVVCLNFIFLFISLKQPLDATAHIRTLKDFSIIDVKHYIHFFDYGFLTLHKFSSNQWNYLLSYPDNISLIIFAIIIFSIFYFIKNNVLKFCMLLSLMAITFINLEIKAVALRHVGFYWIMFLIAMWLDDNKIKKQINYFLIPILLVQIFWGLRIYILDYNMPFSMAEKTVQYLKENDPNLKNYVGYGEFSITSLSANLKMPVLNIKNSKPAYFIKYNLEEDFPNTYKDTITLTQFNPLYNKIGPYVFAMSEEIHTRWLIAILDSLTKTQPKNILKMPEFLGGIVQQENFYLYKIINPIDWKNAEIKKADY